MNKVQQELKVATQNEVVLKKKADMLEKGDKQVNRLSDNCLLPLRTFRLEALLIKSEDPSET